MRRILPAAHRTDMPTWILHFDGLFEPRWSDRAIATHGFVVTHGEARVGEGKGLLLGPGEGGSANVAEFGALIHGPSWLRDHKRDDCPLVVRGDSRLAIERVAGRWNLTSARLLPLRDLARRLVAEVPARETRFEKVPRDPNADADRLARDAYHEAAAARPDWGLGPCAKTRPRARRDQLRGTP